MSYTKEQMTAKQQMIVVCEGMLQLLEPNELSLVMEDISKRVRIRLSPPSSVTNDEVMEDSSRPSKKVRQTRGRELWIRGVKYTTVADACRKHGITDPNAIGIARKDLRSGVSPEDIFRPLEAINKVSLQIDQSGNAVTKSDQVAMGG